MLSVIFYLWLGYVALRSWWSASSTLTSFLDNAESSSQNDFDGSKVRRCMGAMSGFERFLVVFGKRERLFRFGCSERWGKGLNLGEMVESVPDSRRNEFVPHFCSDAV